MSNIGTFDYCDKFTYPFGCVEIDGTKIGLTQLSVAVPGDVVKFDLDAKVIISIESTNFPNIPGVLLCTGPIMGIIKPGIVYRKFIADNSHFPDILISCRKTQSCPNEYGIITIIKAFEGNLYGTYKNKIGTLGNLLDEREYFMYCHNIKRKKYPNKYDIHNYLNDFTPNRVDLTVQNTISIDPDGCEDIDDAISISETDYYEISIHIADVSSFIPVNSDLDNQGITRVESLYLNWVQENMYPKNLVKLMSLFKNCDRRSFTTVIYLDKETLNVNKVECIKSIVNVNQNMTYDEFQQIYNTNHEMNLLYTIGKKLYETGAIINDTRVNYDSHKMVEIYMILCNSAVAKKIYTLGKYLPISRSHTEIKDGLTNLTEDNDIHDIIKHYKSLKAQYVLGKESHDSIGQEFYCHFTSPIRRYVDLMTHRILYYSIIGSDELDTSKFPETLKYINKVRTYIQKGNRESILLDKLYQYHIDNNNVIDASGYIVNITENVVIVYCKEHELEVRCPLYSHKISHLLTIKMTDNSVNLLHTINNNKLCLTLGDIVDLKIVITFLSGRLRNKIMGQLITPDPMALFNFSIKDIE